MGYNSLIQNLDKYGKNELIIEWGNGLKVIGKPDTLFETDNGLEDDDINYAEYYAIAFQVNKILVRPTNKECGIYNWLMEGESSLIEISLYEDTPSRIFLTNEQEIWNKDN